MDVLAYEMKYNKESVARTDINCIPFTEYYFQEYMKIYNECFYEMRKALDIVPYNFLSNFEQIAGRVKDIYLLVCDESIIGSVACYGNEIDDLIVNPKYQKKGYGKQLLLWGMRYIRQKSNGPITLHVAEWNECALMLYRKMGFEITSIERIR